MSGKKTIVAPAAVFLLFGLMFARAEPTEPGDDTNTVVTVQTGKLQLATLHGYVSGFGLVAPAPAEENHPAAYSQVAAPVAGIVSQVNVWEGKRVERSETLVQLDSRVADVAVEFARKTLERQQKLLAMNNTSQKAVQDAAQQLASAEAERQLLTIRAPLSGIVTTVTARPGESVDPTAPLVEIIDLSRLIIKANIPSDEAGPLRPGQAVELLTDPPGATSLSFVSATINSSNGAVMVRMPAPGNSGMRPGQLVPLRIVVAEHTNCLAAPEQSVVTDDDNNQVIAVVTNDFASRVKVRMGLRENGLVEVQAPGLREGTTVVTVGAYGLPPQTKIKVQQPGGQ